MVRVLGNSPERIKIGDLGDVLYYRQQKDYTDQEYETSKDLQREIRNGRVTVIERYQNKGTAVNPGQDPVIVRQQAGPGLSQEDVKLAVLQALSGSAQPKNGDIVRDVVQTLLPMIGDTIRQEMGKIPRQGVVQSEVQEMRSSSMEYIPTVSTEGMVSNIEIETKMSSSDDVASNLDLLRKLQTSK